MRHLPSDPRHRRLQGYINRADIELSRIADQMDALHRKAAMWRDLRRASFAVWDDLNDADEDLASALGDLGLPTASESTAPMVPA